MNDLDQMGAAIVGVLETVTEFKKVFDHEPLSVPGHQLPAASVFYTGFRLSDEEIPRGQQVIEQWILRVYVPLQDAEKAQDDIKKLVPKVRKALRGNRKLDSTCRYSTVTAGDIIAVLDKNNPQLIASFTLDANTEERD